MRKIRNDLILPLTVDNVSAAFSMPEDQAAYLLWVWSGFIGDPFAAIRDSIEEITHRLTVVTTMSTGGLLGLWIMQPRSGVLLYSKLQRAFVGVIPFESIEIYLDSIGTRTTDDWFRLVGLPELALEALAAEPQYIDVNPGTLRTCYDLYVEDALNLTPLRAEFSDLPTDLRNQLRFRDVDVVGLGLRRFSINTLVWDTLPYTLNAAPDSVLEDMKRFWASFDIEGLTRLQRLTVRDEIFTALNWKPWIRDIFQYRWEQYPEHREAVVVRHLNRFRECVQARYGHGSA